MVAHPPKHDKGPGLTALPFGGLGQDLAEVRRAARGLLLVPFPRQETLLLQQPRIAPPAPSGYGLLVRLGRETLGS